MRHRIEHFGLPTADHLARAARAGVIAAPQTVFVHALGRNFRHYLPDALLARAYPVRAMLDAGRDGGALVGRARRGRRFAAARDAGGAAPARRRRRA